MKNNGRASVYSMTGTSAMKMPRHNVNESLKKKLGIANCRAAAVPTPPAVPTTTHSSPMISGVKGRSKRVTTPKQLEFPDPSNDCPRSTGRAARITPKQKNAKRESKKVVQANNSSREITVQAIPEEMWFSPGQSQDDAFSPLHMYNWFIPELCDTVPASITTTVASASAACPPLLQLSRDERLELKRSELRRRTIQVRNAQQHREIVTARRRFLYVQSVLLQETGSHDQTTMVPASAFSEELRLCRVDGCQNEALIFTAFCPEHVTGSHDEQLFASCSVRFADKSQCSRVPVFDESHEVPLCKEHAAEREKDPRRQPRITADRVAVVSGKLAAAPVAAKNKKKKSRSNKRSTVPVNQPRASAMPKVDLTPSLPRKSVYLSHPNEGGDAVRVNVQKPLQLLPATQQKLKTRRPEIVTRYTKVGSDAMQKILVKEEQYDFVDEEDSVGLEEEEEDSLLQPRSKKSSPFAMKRKSFRANYGVAPTTAVSNQTDLLLVSENSSAYESSEDTGVGGLSESEMIGEFVFILHFFGFIIYNCCDFFRGNWL